MLFYRQKLLLALLEIFGGQLNKFDLQKYLFLFTTICQKEKSYEFIPYQYGCFSFQSYADFNKLSNLNLVLETDDSWKLCNQDNYLSLLNDEDRKNLLLFKRGYKNLKGNDLIRETYIKYPYFAIRSKKADSLLTKEEMLNVKKEIPDQNDFCFFTIGYEGSSFENYLNRLIKNNIHILCDVRKNPLSRKYGFSKNILSKTLEKIGINYLHISELGIISEKRKNLKSKNDYQQLFDEYENTVLKNNKDAVHRLFDIFMKYKRVAITCFEADQCMCHRNRVIKALEKLPNWNYKIHHI